MRHPSSAHVAAFVCLVLQVAFATSALSQWLPTGVPATSIPEQRGAHLVPDGLGGAFLGLVDFQDFALNERDIWGTRLLVTGETAPGWPSSGVLMGRSSWLDQVRPGCLNPDGSATFPLLLSYEFSAVRMLPDGSVAPGWNPDSSIFLQQARGADYPSVCPTLDGSNFFVWLQNDSMGKTDVWMQRLSPDGTPAPGWPVAGKRVFAAAHSASLSFQRCLIPDGADGAWLAVDWFVGSYSNSLPAEGDAYLLHLDRDGNPVPGFPPGGRNITTIPGVQAYPAICADSSGGVIVAWVDGRTGPTASGSDLLYYLDLYAQRFDSTGAIASNWPVNGVPVAITPILQQNQQVIADGAGGAYIAWDGDAPGGRSIAVQHLLSDGSIAPGWVANGNGMLPSDRFGYNPKFASDQQGGLFITVSARSNAQCWLQHVNPNGVFDGPWGAGGLSLGLPSPSGSDFSQSVDITPSLPGSVVVAWDDRRAGAARTYVSRVTLDGVVATQASLVSHEEAADHVALAWFVSEGGGVDVHVERSSESGAWIELATISPDASGMARYDDFAVEPTVRYGYRLRWSGPGGWERSSETWITVPAVARFALIGAQPNPARRSQLRVAYSLPEVGTARVELYDAQGRCVAVREERGQAAGSHSTTFDRTSALRAGLYWVRLSQGARQATTKVVIVD